VRGSLGLVIGLVVGAGAMYLVLRPPWGGGTTSSVDAGTVAVAPTDAGAQPPKKRRPRRPGTTTSAGQDGVDEPDLPPLTASERALEWRGDDVTLPTQKIDVGGSSEARALEQGEIDAAVASQTGGVRDCVVRGATGTDLQATITIRMVVDGNGRVTRSKLEAPRYLLEHGLLGCVQQALRGMRFPATGAPTLVTFPVHLG
jgi:hypothetical protein